MQPICTLEGHCEPVNSLSFSPDNRILVTSSSDRSCIIFNIDRAGDKRQLGVRLHKITFSDGTNDAKNMMMRGCFFSGDSRYLYTLSTENRQRSYIVKWENKQKFLQKAVQSEPVEVAVIHPNTVTGMCVSPDGSQIGVRTSDGFVKVIATNSFSSGKFGVSQRRHRMPVTCLSFKTDADGNSTHILSGSSDYTYNIIPSRQSLLSNINPLTFTLVWLLTQALWLAALGLLVFIVLT